MFGLKLLSMEKLKAVTSRIGECFREAVDSWQDPCGAAHGKPEVKFSAKLDFPVMRLTEDDPVIKRMEQAARVAGIVMSYEEAGGGSDANIFNGKGLETAIVATGMTHVHSCDEQITLQNMVDLTRLLLALITGKSFA